MKFAESQGATASARWFISSSIQVGFRIWGHPKGEVVLLGLAKKRKKDDQHAGVCNEGDR